MKIWQTGKEALDDLKQNWQKGDLSKKINIGLGIASVASAPLGAFGVWSAETLQDDKSQINLNSPWGKILKTSAFTYPLVWTFIQGFIGSGQGIMSGSFLTSGNGILALVSTFVYDFLLYKILGLKTETKKMQTETPFNSDLNALQADSEKYTALLNLYTSLYISLFSFTGEFGALPDLSPDIKKAYRIKPIDSEQQLKSFGNFFERAKFNLGQEILATKQAIGSIFRPNRWKTAEGVNQFLEEKKIKKFLHPFIKVCSSPLPSIMACFSASFRLAAGLLFLITLPILGLKPHKEKLSEAEKQNLQTEHPLAYKAFQVAQKLKSLVMWLTGLMSVSMGFSRSYKEFASETASILQGSAGLVSIAAGITQGPIARLMTFISALSLTFANGIRNLAGTKK